MLVSCAFLKQVKFIPMVSQFNMSTSSRCIMYGCREKRKKASKQTYVYFTSLETVCAHIS